MKPQRSGFVFRRAISLGSLFCLVLILTIGSQDALRAEQSPLPGSPASQRPASAPSPACDEAIFIPLAHALNQAWAANNHALEALTALNMASFTCYLGADNISRCDVNALSDPQLKITMAQVKKQPVPADLYNRYADTLAGCLSQPPAPPPATAATSEAATPSPGPQTPAATTMALDCDTRFARWMLYGLPEITDSKALSAYYSALLNCFEPKALVALCNLPALTKLHLGIQASGKPLTADGLRTNQKTLLECFGYTPVLLQGFGGLAAGGGGFGGGGSGGGGGNGGGNGGSDGGSSQGTETNPSGDGPYVVKQIRSLGGETISGVVCSLSQPFSVAAKTPKVAFTFQFAPADATHGTVTYAYTIPSAGESHDATGTYTIGQPAADGSLTLSMSIKDHVVFKGFDGIMPIQYSFSLVPSATAPCPR